MDITDHKKNLRSNTAFFLCQLAKNYHFSELFLLQLTIIIDCQIYLTIMPIGSGLPGLESLAACTESPPSAARLDEAVAPILCVMRDSLLCDRPVNQQLPPLLALVELP